MSFDLKNTIHVVVKLRIFWELWLLPLNHCDIIYLNNQNGTTNVNQHQNLTMSHIGDECCHRNWNWIEIEIVVIETNNSKSECVNSS